MHRFLLLLLTFPQESQLGDIELREETEAEQFRALLHCDVLLDDVSQTLEAAHRFQTAEAFR